MGVERNESALFFKLVQSPACHKPVALVIWRLGSGWASQRVSWFSLQSGYWVEAGAELGGKLRALGLPEVKQESARTSVGLLELCRGSFTGLTGDTDCFQASVQDAGCLEM